MHVFFFQYDNIKGLTKQVVQVTAPDYVFEMVYSKDRNERFKDLQGDRGLLYAYHGSRTDNFHSITHHGLHSHMNKVSHFQLMIKLILIPARTQTFVT